MHVRPFVGPLFIVGMPRSGTKLLREMLNQHPRIHFSEIETQFFPFWVSRWQKFRAIERREGFERFYRACLEMPFFIQLAERGQGIDCWEWFDSCESYTPAAVFEALIRGILNVPRQADTMIWGDKSPSYVRHIPLLMHQFPEAKVIHIIRDVRDYCLSIQKAWGKNMLRAAQRWQDDVSTGREDGLRFPSTYMEIRFEDLLVDPRRILVAAVEFIGVEFDERMLTPGARTENLGDAKGIRGVLTENWGKYRSRMSNKMVTRIEKIACPSLRALDYPCAYTGPPVRLSACRLRVLQLADGIGLFRGTLAKRSLIESFRHRLRNFRTSGNRAS